MASATDNFNRADLDNLGTNWTGVVIPAQTTGKIQLLSLEINPSNANKVEVEWWNVNSFGANQYAQAKVVAVASNTHRIGPMVRITESNTVQQGYAAFFTSDNIYLQLGNSTDGSAGWTVLGSTGSGPVVNDVIKVEASGNQITVKKNGSIVIGPITDATYASGRTGMAAYSTGTSVRADDWEGGDLDAPVAQSLDYAGEFRVLRVRW